MRTLEGGCSVPIGVETGWEEDKLRMRAIVVSLDGRRSVEEVMEGVVREESEADDFGWTMAGKLVDKGAGEILKDINLNRELVTA